VNGKLLIAGVGNIFLGDDGFGVEVARRLADADMPDWVRVADYGIRGMHLAYDLANGYDSAILVDATARGGAAGTVYVIEPDLDTVPGIGAAGGDLTAEDGQPGNNPLFDAHGMQPDVVFGMLGMLGASTRQVLVVGCEPASLDYGIGLSPPVAGAVDEAVRVVLDLVAGAAASGDAHQLVTKEWTHVPRDTR
jgi:hydrogenase maturation protease